MSIIRIGLGETEGFSDGYEAIFGKKKPKPEVKAEPAKPTEAERTEVATEKAKIAE